MSDEACCACLTVCAETTPNDNGTVSTRWKCAACGTQFIQHVFFADAEARVAAIRAEHEKCIVQMGDDYDKSLTESLNERDAAKEAVVGLVYQFASAVPVNGVPAFFTNGLSALEEAFEVLGWEDPHPAPEIKCDEPGCARVASCGTPSKGGPYRRVCGTHFHAIDAAERAALADAGKKTP